VKAPKQLHGVACDGVLGAILRGRNSNFIKYDTWLKCAQGVRLELSGDAPLFPAMLPYPEVLDEHEGGGLHLTARWARSFLNVFVAWSNFVVLGCPHEDGSGFEPRVGYRCLEHIREFADRLLGEVEEFVCDELARGTLKVEGKKASIEEVLMGLQCTGSACYFDSAGKAAAKVASTALPVVSSRVAIPPQVSAEEEPALADRLLEAGMAALVPESELPRRSDGSLLSGGLFAVRKNDSEAELALLGFFYVHAST